MNVELLKKVRDHILANSDRLFMEEGLIIGLAGDKVYFRGGGEVCIPECGAVGCIAGWTCLLGDSDFKNNPRCTLWYYIQRRAQELLGITDAEAASLFNVYDWHSVLRDRYYEAKSNQEKAALIKQRINMFIRGI